MHDKIITIGIAPCWDRTIEIDDIDWNQHKVISSQKTVPAGKALNINKALAWIGEESTAAGLWGDEDFSKMKEICRVGFPVRRSLNEDGSPRGNSGKINIRLTKVPGKTRENITLVDKKNNRQMHLRTISTLANKKTINILKKDLHKIIVKHSFCIFAGAMPDEAIELIEFAKKKGAAVVVDTSGPALKKIVSKGGLLLIKPNIDELSELISKKIRNEEKDIISAAKKLLKKVKFILVSRGDKGAMLMFSPHPCGGGLSQNTLKNDIVAISAKYTGKKYPVYNTVACGDYLLAGFIKSYLAPLPAKGFVNLFDNLKRALQDGVTAASAKAFGMNGKISWKQAQRKIRIYFNSSLEK